MVISSTEVIEGFYEQLLCIAFVGVRYESVHPFSGFPLELNTHLSVNFRVLKNINNLDDLINNNNTIMVMITSGYIWVI